MIHGLYSISTIRWYKVPTVSILQDDTRSLQYQYYKMIQGPYSINWLWIKSLHEEEFQYFLSQEMSSDS